MTYAPRLDHRAFHRTLAILLILMSFGSSANTSAQEVVNRARARNNAAAAQARIVTANERSIETNSARPRLVLLIVVDQFRYDYLERFGDLFVANGLRRLMRDGASWTQSNYDHMPTYTAPGHATLMTGTWPAENGIIANEWYDRETNKNVTSVSDDAAQLLGGDPKERASSPKRLMASTLGDELRLATNDRAKVIGISLKDRAAILPVGRHATAAYWFSAHTGTFVSSDYYFKQLPAWVASFNAGRPGDKYFGARWERLLSEAEYIRRAGVDAPAWEDVSRVKDTNTFPHVITGGASAPNGDFYEALAYSPFANDLLVSFAEAAITNENLGTDEDTDLLSVSFSANDYVGHRFGPYSQEAMDMTLRVDRQIAELLDFVNARIGLQNTLVIFTADHGMAPIPEHAAAIGLPGGRVQSADVLRAVRNALSLRYRKANGSDPSSDYISQYKEDANIKDAFTNGNLYFSKAALVRDGVNQEEIERIAGEAMMTVPGINRYFTRTQLLQRAISPADPIARRVLHGFYPLRSGDVIALYDPYKYLVDSWITATHGSPYLYDTHVPLILMGSGLAAGRYEEAATPADIAPTVAAILHLQPPSNATGRVLLEGLTATATAKARRAASSR